ncbi:HTH type 11 transcriptional regulator [Anopheles sinensis]|uniref:HTH type 11 transcriptional regulator n=1 Tax=Anopheles sinensis TaxID=74873 RepID=A0A084VLX2_ANOSI|nr:HTH type 11 transcriptional regulator [Anopheles sinensis]
MFLTNAGYGLDRIDKHQPTVEHTRARAPIIVTVTPNTPTLCKWKKVSAAFTAIFVPASFSTFPSRINVFRPRDGWVDI